MLLAAFARDTYTQICICNNKTCVQAVLNVAPTLTRVPHDIPDSLRTSIESLQHQYLCMSDTLRGDARMCFLCHCMGGTISYRASMSCWRVVTVL